MKNVLLLFAAWLCATTIMGQSVKVEGYVFEENNRGYLNQVAVTIKPKELMTDSLVIQTDENGYFELNLPLGQAFFLTAAKDLFYTFEQDFSTNIDSSVNNVYLKIELRRKPGYIFDITMAAERDSIDTVGVEGIVGAWIEIFNNTTDEQVLELKEFEYPNFKYTFQKGNHYTLLIRKQGYFAKRLEAYIDVDGCILCFDGLARIENVTDNLTAGFEMGTILANIELKPASIGSTFALENIYYDFGKASLRKEAYAALNNLYTILKDNPSIKVELGSHTDSRGGDRGNLKLSQKRAESAVAYLLEKGISPLRIESKGYGETEITNRCIDGVDCSETEHQLNRRTEIKVLDIMGGEKVDDQPLSEIKRLEKYAEELTSIEDDQQIFVAGQDDDDMPEDLKAYIAEQNRKECQEKLEKASLLPTYFQGFAIEIEQIMTDSIPGEWILQHNDVYKDELKGNKTALYISIFDNIDEAQIFYEDQRLDSYNAKIIEYTKGERN